MLVVVKHRNIHPLAELTLHVETFGCFDVFEHNAAEGGFERRNNIDELFRVSFVNFQIEGVDVGEFFHEDRFALHDGLRCQRTNGAQSQNSGAITDDRNQIASCGYLGGVKRVLNDVLTGMGNAG